MFSKCSLPWAPSSPPRHSLPGAPQGARPQLSQRALPYRVAARQLLPLQPAVRLTPQSPARGSRSQPTAARQLPPLQPAVRLTPQSPARGSWSQPTAGAECCTPPSGCNVCSGGSFITPRVRANTRCASRPFAQQRGILGTPQLRRTSWDSGATSSPRVRGGLTCHARGPPAAQPRSVPHRMWLTLQARPFSLPGASPARAGGGGSGRCGVRPQPHSHSCACSSACCWLPAQQLRRSRPRPQLPCTAAVG